MIYKLEAPIVLCAYFSIKSAPFQLILTECYFICGIIMYSEFTWELRIDFRFY